MRIPRFWHRRLEGDAAGLESSGAWRESGLAGEVQAFLAGRLVVHLTATHQPVPAWAALNRLAHADRPELVRLVEGATVGWETHPSAEMPYWAAAERFVAGHLLARAPTPGDLARLQGATLVPLELRLIEQSKVDRLTVDKVLEMAAEALDTYRTGR